MTSPLLLIFTRSAWSCSLNAALDAAASFALDFNQDGFMTLALVLRLLLRQCGSFRKNVMNLILLASQDRSAGKRKNRL